MPGRTIADVARMIANIGTAAKLAAENTKEATAAQREYNDAKAAGTTSGMNQAAGGGQSTMGASSGGGQGDAGITPSGLAMALQQTLGRIK